MDSALHIDGFCEQDKAAVITLWQQCGLIVAHNDPDMDIKRKLRQQPELFLTGKIQKQLVATAMVGFDGHRGWLNYLAVAPDWQRRGIGRMVMAEAERRLLALGCPKLNLQVRGTNTQVVAFYQALGYTQDKVVSMGKRLIKD